MLARPSARAPVAAQAAEPSAAGVSGAAGVASGDAGGAGVVGATGVAAVPHAASDIERARVASVRRGSRRCMGASLREAGDGGVRASRSTARETHERFASFSRDEDGAAVGARAGSRPPERRWKVGRPIDYPFARTTRNSMTPLSWTAMRPATFGASMS